ncbi:hypothetical protein CVT26_014470 [Gymnopilus dilepis]|uniref:Uncharacterized protein n=1 Tax=Gymnopilus dilepis TaxID=231916 RepID=A0A409VVF0_9AGAR|nr:hypothetical protein CVT26_014470 [Gymnopilus dilepis]
MSSGGAGSVVGHEKSGSASFSPEVATLADKDCRTGLTATSASASGVDAAPSPAQSTPPPPTLRSKSQSLPSLPHSPTQQVHQPHLEVKQSQHNQLSAIDMLLLNDMGKDAPLELGIASIISSKRKRFKDHARYIGEEKEAEDIVKAEEQENIVPPEAQAQALPPLPAAPTLVIYTHTTPTRRKSSGGDLSLPSVPAVAIAPSPVLSSSLPHSLFPQDQQPWPAHEARREQPAQPIISVNSLLLFKLRGRRRHMLSIPVSPQHGPSRSVWVPLQKSRPGTLPTPHRPSSHPSLPGFEG